MGARGAKLVALSGKVMGPSADKDSLEEMGTVTGKPHFLPQLSASIYQAVITL